MSLSVNSNLDVTQETVNLLLNLHPNLLITSLDADACTHEQSRGSGYQRIVANIRKLIDAGVAVRLNCVLNHATLPNIGVFVDKFAPLGCGFCFILLRPVGRAGVCFTTPPLQELIQAVDVINKKRIEYPQSYFSTSFHVIMEEELIIDGINLTGCNAIQKSFNINSDGTVLPCAFLYELSKQTFSLGNIRNTEYSVLPIWQQSTLLCELRKQSAATNARCISCSHFKSDCLGSCIFMELYSKQTGCIDPYCKLSTESIKLC